MLSEMVTNVTVHTRRQKNHAVNTPLSSSANGPFAILIPIFQKIQKYLFIIDIMWLIFHFDVLTTDTA